MYRHDHGDHFIVRGIQKLRQGRIITVARAVSCTHRGKQVRVLRRSKEKSGVCLCVCVARSLQPQLKNNLKMFFCYELEEFSGERTGQPPQVSSEVTKLVQHYVQNLRKM